MMIQEPRDILLQLMNFVLALDAITMSLSSVQYSNFSVPCLFSSGEAPALPVQPGRMPVLHGP